MFCTSIPYPVLAGSRVFLTKRKERPIRPGARSQRTHPYPIPGNPGTRVPLFTLFATVKHFVLFSDHKSAEETFVYGTS
eukprot:2170268-Rhodomonas_salina.1